MGVALCDRRTGSIGMVGRAGNAERKCDPAGILALAHACGDAVVKAAELAFAAVTANAEGNIAELAKSFLWGIVSIKDQQARSMGTEEAVVGHRALHDPDKVIVSNFVFSADVQWSFPISRSPYQVPVPRARSVHGLGFHLVYNRIPIPIPIPIPMAMLMPNCFSIPIPDISPSLDSS